MTIVGATPFLILNFIFLLWLYHCMVVASLASFHTKLKSSRMTQRFCFKGEIAKLVMVDKVLCSNKLRRERSSLKEVWTGFTKEILHTYVPSFPPQVIPLRITKLHLCSISLLVKTPSTKRLQRPKGKFMLKGSTEPNCALGYDILTMYSLTWCIYFPQHCCSFFLLLQ